MRRREFQITKESRLYQKFVHIIQYFFLWLDYEAM